MNRDYSTGKGSEVKFFTGIEVEKTPAFGLKTLFVVGIQNVEEINSYLADHSCEHIFFGANHSFNPVSVDDWNLWESMIETFLRKDYLCSLDIPLRAVEAFNDGGLNEYNNFIPQIRVAIPYMKLWNYNTMIKIDDKDFNSTNPGIWTHSLHDLKDKEKFTSWHQYKKDKIIK